MTTPRPRAAAPLEPLGLSRCQAAAYVGVSPSLFDRAVTDGLMPPPRRCYGRRVWDRFELAEYFQTWPHDGGVGAGNAEENPW